MYMLSGKNNHMKTTGVSRYENNMWENRVVRFIDRVFKYTSDGEIDIKIEHYDIQNHGVVINHLYNRAVDLAEIFGLDEKQLSEYDDGFCVQCDRLICECEDWVLR